MFDNIDKLGQIKKKCIRQKINKPKGDNIHIQMLMTLDLCDTQNCQGECTNDFVIGTPK